jgi:hypothetical protein
LVRDTDTRSIAELQKDGSRTLRVRENFLVTAKQIEKICEGEFEFGA